ncbi:MAG: dephospho-CoA kinase [Nitrospirae bacterium]|nr:dephospho-CoA kinase [Nitrospirota bacterium]
MTKKYVVDKKRLASMIFNDPEKRKTLERIIHPEVLKTARDIKSTILLKDPHAIILFEIPLLFEAGYEKIFDRIIVVHCNKKTAITRLIRKGFPKEEAIKRMQAQIPISRKKASADFLINNNSTIEKTKTQVRRIFNLLQ